MSRLYRASVKFSFNGAAHGGPADSGNRRKDSAGHLPHEARTTQSLCCPPHLQRMIVWFTWFSMYTFIQMTGRRLKCTSLTKTAHQPLGSNAWHDVRVLLGASVLLGLQYTVGIL